MASSRAPKFIQIQRGEHDRSPHLTSPRKDEIRDAANDHADFFDAPKEYSTPISIKMNFVPPQPGVREKIQDRMKHAATAAENATHKTASIFKKIHLPHVTLPKFPKFSKKVIKPESRKKIKPVAVAAIPTQKIHVPRNRASIAFILVAFLLVTPLKAITTYEQISAAQTDVQQLKNSAVGQMAGDLTQASSLVTDALRSFHSANTQLQHIDRTEEFILRHTPVIGAKFGVASRLVAAGEHTSLAAASYMQLFRTLKTKSDAPLIERLNLFFEGNRAVVSDLAAAADLVRPIDTSVLPDDQRVFVAQARDAILALSNDAEYLSSAGPVILSMLGNVSPRRYLIVFQNPTELRPTGGFIGSFAIVDIENGEVKNLQVPAGGSYDLQGSLKKHLRAPLPLNIINPRWQFQDGNWFPDFPTSAQKLEWFLEKSQGPTVDGVIAVNSTLLPELLAVVGPVKIKDSGTELTAENALATVRESINVAAGENDTKPKQIIANAAPAVIETLKAGKAEHFLPVITTLLKALENRDIQLYARDEELQNRITEFGWDGAIRDNPGADYLSVIATNIGGQKTDSLIDQTIDHQAKIDPDGTVTVTVHIKRQQRRSGKEFEGGPNVSYLRYYVPNGSTIVSAKGFTFPAESLFRAPEPWDQTDTDLTSIEQEIGIDPKSGTRITKEFGHTVFGNWMITQPSGTSESAISYTLPNKIAPKEPEGIGKVASYFYDSGRPSSYSLYLQRQSGATNTTVTSRVILPEGWALGWVTDKRAQVAENGLLLTLPFITDIHYAVTAYATNNQTIEAPKD